MLLVLLPCCFHEQYHGYPFFTLAVVQKLSAMSNTSLIPMSNLASCHLQFACGGCLGMMLSVSAKSTKYKISLRLIVLHKVLVFCYRSPIYER